MRHTPRASPCTGAAGTRLAKCRASRWSVPTGCGRACALRLGGSPPRFRRRTAWRALAPAEAVTGAFQEPDIHLWLGQDAHLVHYPVMGGALINIVAIVRDDWQEPGWTASGSRDEIRARFVPSQWAEPARTLLDVPDALAQMGALRSPAAAALGTRAGHAYRRCRPSDASVPRAGGSDGDRGCLRAVRVPRQYAR